MSQTKAKESSKSSTTSKTGETGEASVKAEKLRKGMQSTWAGFAQLLKGLFSKDAPTRRMSAFFFLSVLGVLLVLGVGVQRFLEMRSQEASEAQKAAQHLGDFLARQAEEAKKRASQVPVGAFSVELEPMEGQAKKIPGVQNMAEIELVLDCDSKETREFIEKHLPQVRNEITGFFTAMDRNELMSKDGKKRLKKGIIDRVNNWLPHGRVEDVYITRFILA